jgi:hypothetical protein
VHTAGLKTALDTERTGWDIEAVEWGKRRVGSGMWGCGVGQGAGECPGP